MPNKIYSVKDVVEAFKDVLDGNQDPHEIRAATGLPMERCQEIAEIHAAALAGDIPLN